MKRLPQRLLSVLTATAFGAASVGAAVSVERVPDLGMQPQAVAAADLTHLIYLTGDPKAAVIVYRTRAGTGDWSAPVRVNSQPGSAIAIGTIRGPQMALGRNGRVHVVWNGSSIAEPRPAHGGSPMLYARLADDGKSFSPQRNLMTAGHELDGGGSVAADAHGNVQVIWHASPAGMSGETNRVVYVASSENDGLTFAAERVASLAGSGTCGCCGLTAGTGPRGETLVLFRAARTPTQRDMTLLASAGANGAFQQLLTDPWPVSTCPMSSAGITAAGDQVWAAWETDGRIRLAHFAGGTWRTKLPAVGPLQGAKHPRIAINDRGEALVVWTEGTGWQKGGWLAWQVFDASGQPTSDRGGQVGIPAWSYATACAQPGGDFVILY